MLATEKLSARELNRNWERERHKMGGKRNWEQTSE